jgi:hypothetical protein
MLSVVGEVVNILVYADNIVLVSPAYGGLQCLPDIVVGRIYKSHLVATAI